MSAVELVLQWLAVLALFAGLFVVCQIPGYRRGFRPFRRIRTWKTFLTTGFMFDTEDGRFDGVILWSTHAARVTATFAHHGWPTPTPTPVKWRRRRAPAEPAPGTVS